MYKNIRFGRVSAIFPEEHMVRVTFTDCGETIVSGKLKILKSPPFIPEKDEEQRTEEEGGGSGEAAFESHSHAVKIAPWFPDVGVMVLCLYTSNVDGSGVVIGEIS